MCKGSDVFSLTVLIDRGLDLQIRTDVNEHILTGSGADDGEGTPVPIPNTAVKLTRADDTWLEAAR